MKLLIALRRGLGQFLSPYESLDRWLLSHWPMIWAERYHLALAVGVAVSLAAITVGFAQGAAVTYSLGSTFSLRLDRALWVAPWCIVAGWCWARAKGYGSLPVVKVRHGLYYPVFDLAVIIVLLLIPYHYSWALRAGLSTHVDELERIAQDEFSLKTAWNAWFSLLEREIGEINEELRNLGEDAPPTVFSVGRFDSIRDEFPQLAAAVGEGPDPLARIGIASKDLWQRDPLEPRGGEVVLSERAKREREKLEHVLAPLFQKYVGADLGPYLTTGRQERVKAREAVELLEKVAAADRAFDAFHDTVVRFDEYDSRDAIEPQTWILFPALLTLLAIPATTARVYWIAWAMMMTGWVVILVFSFIFDDLLSEGAATVLSYGLAATAALTLVLALTRRTIGKNEAVKMLSVFVPLVLVFVPLFVGSDVTGTMPYKLATALIAGAISRAVFNRLRSLPDPY